MQKSRNHIVLIELVPGSKGEGVDTAEITVRRILDELLDRAYRLRLRRSPQNNEEVFGFAGKSHVTIKWIAVAVTVCVGKTESKRQIRQRPLRRGFSLPYRSSYELHSTGKSRSERMKGENAEGEQ